jgi:hypothetical protein
MTRSIFRLLACAAVLAAPLAFTTPAAADPSDEMECAAPPQSGEHQKFHEQCAQLRAEHEQLVGERDRLMERCMDAKGQDKSACDEKWADLRARHEAWRERMVAFHEQATGKHDAKGMHGHKGKHAHHGEWKNKHHHDMKQGSKTPTAPPSTPASSDQ